MPIADVLLTLTLELIKQAGSISTIIQQVQASGATTLTPEQWAVITGADDSADTRLLAALAAAKSPSGLLTQGVKK
jgi:3'-phosphoadenosine 5'-phosphosulfate (PAPS) 3'-phosphatase